MESTARSCCTSPCSDCAMHRLVGPRVVGRSGLLKVVASLAAFAGHARGQVLLQRLDAPALSVEGVFQMAYILPERLLALVRPAFDLVLQRIRSLKRCVQA